jgi:hypothetical protein
MAVLSSNTLSGCSSIPSFLGGSADTPANPTVSVFRNTNAPTNWVKKTTHNDKALRVIGGANGTSLSPGGSSSFTTILTSSKPFPGTITASTTGIGNAGPNPSGFSGTSELILNSVPNYTPSTPEMPSHSHPTIFFNPTLNSAGPLAYGTIAAASNVVSTNPGDGSAGTGHVHSLSGGSHTHPISDPGHTHTVSPESSHTHSFTGSAQNFAVTYVDIIIATKS